MEVFNVAYEEALKASGKTATQLLNETCVKYKVQPQYEYIPTPGRPPNKPEFTCKVTVRAQPLDSSSADLRTYIEEAKSARKKDAQQLAATLVLRQILPIKFLQGLRKNPSSGEDSPTKGGTSPTKGGTSSPPDSDFLSKIDPLDPKTLPPTIINDLTLACCEKGLASPRYEDVGQEGPSHCPVFTVRSWIPLKDGSELSEEVRAASKKDGRKIGCFRLFQRIAALPKDVSISERIDAESIHAKRCAEDPDYCAKHIAHFDHKFQRWNNEFLVSIKEKYENNKDDALRLLQELAKDKGFTISFRDFATPEGFIPSGNVLLNSLSTVSGSFSGLGLSDSEGQDEDSQSDSSKKEDEEEEVEEENEPFKNFLMLSTDPTIVVHGEGASLEESHIHAAQNALEHLFSIIKI